MSDPGHVIFKNKMQYNMLITLSYLSCMDNIREDQQIDVNAGSDYDLGLFRTDGHGCNGNNGTFIAGYKNDLGRRMLQVAITGDGEVGLIPDTGPWLPDPSFNPPKEILSKHVTSADVTRQTIVFYNSDPFEGPKPDCWNNPRPPTAVEEDYLESIVGFKPDTVSVYGTDGLDYNCLSWAMGKTAGLYWLDPAAPTKEQLDELFSVHGIAQVGSQEESNIIAWGSNNTVLHLSRWCLFPNIGFSWSSKMGMFKPTVKESGLLITHGADYPQDFNGKGYGELIAYYRSPYEPAMSDFR